MTENPNAFFILWAMYFILKGVKSEHKIKYAIFSGLSMTFASGFRYESWEIMAIFGLIILLYREWKFFIIYCSFAIIFPLYWMIGNYIVFNDIFYGITGNVIQKIVNDNLTREEIISRFLYFPNSWFILISPFVSIAIIFSIFKHVIKKQFTKEYLIWLIPFLILFITFIYKAYHGTLLKQHRFTITLIALSIPYIALLFQQNKFLKIKKAFIITVIISMLPMSYVLKAEKAIPVLQNKSIEYLLNDINYNSGQYGLILDFLGWEETYFIALGSNENFNETYIEWGATHGKVQPDEINKLLDKNPIGLIVIKDNSRLYKSSHFTGSLMEIDGVYNTLYLEKIVVRNDIKLFKYYLRSKQWGDKYKALFSNITSIYPTERNVDFYIEQVKASKEWYDIAKKDAIKTNISIEKNIRNIGNYMVDMDVISKLDTIK